MQSDVPLCDDFFVTAAGPLLDPAIVVPVFEEEDAPVLDGLQLDEGEQGLLFDRLQDESDEVLRRIDRRTLSVYDELVEVSENHIATQFFQAV